MTLSLLILESDFEKTFEIISRKENKPVELIREPYLMTLGELASEGNLCKNVETDYEIFISKEIDECYYYLTERGEKLNIKDFEYIQVSLRSIKEDSADFSSLINVSSKELLNCEVNTDEFCSSFSNERKLSEILWEITFFGFLEEDRLKFIKNI